MISEPTWTEGASLCDQFAESMNYARAATMFLHHMHGLHDHVLSEALTKLSHYLKTRRKGSSKARQIEIRELVLAEMARRVTVQLRNKMGDDAYAAWEKTISDAAITARSKQIGELTSPATNYH